MLVFYACHITAAFLELIIYFVGRRPKDDMRIVNLESKVSDYKPEIAGKIYLYRHKIKKEKMFSVFGTRLIFGFC